MQVTWFVFLKKTKCTRPPLIGTQEVADRLRPPALIVITQYTSPVYGPVDITNSCWRRVKRPARTRLDYRAKRSWPFLLTSFVPSLILHAIAPLSL